jgi:hypothetical protein
MATNTERDDLGRLIIKYAPTSGYTPEVRAKLVCSVELARRAVSNACERLRWLAVKSDVTLADIGDVPYRTLRRHFSFAPIPSSGVIPDVTWTAWAKNINTIAFNLVRISQGLERPVTIADAQASNEKKFHPIGVARLTAFYPDPAKRKMVDEVAQTYARGEAMARSGFVAVKSAANAAMPPGALSRYLAGDLSVKVDASDKGSIHLNFLTQLADRSVTNLRVAGTIIHEASHKFCDTRDFAYSQDAGYGALTSRQALMNADSYAFAAVCLYKGHVFQDEAAMTTPPTGVNMNA